MKKLVTVIAALAVIAMGCSSDESGDTTTTSEAIATTVAEATTTTTTVAETTTTAAETTTTTAPSTPVVPIETGDPDHDQIVDLFAVVFSGETSFEEKAPFIDDPSGLESTVNQYNQAAASVGGLSLVPTSIGIDADDALVIYDLYFGENPFQVDQEGEAIRNAEHWQVTRSYFCSIVKLARVDCT